MSVDATPVTPGAGETTLQGLRTLVVQKTGRYELVGTQASGGDTIPDYAVDNGVDFFINKATKWLDEQTSKQRRKDVALTAGTYEVTVNSASIAIDYVDLVDSAQELIPVNELWLKENFGPDFALSASGTPLYWAFQTEKDSGSGATKLWLLPIADTDTTVQIHGKYYESVLVNNSDTNWWTLRHAEKVVYVAILLLNELDLNSSVNNTLFRLVEEIRKAIISADIMDEITLQGNVMRG